MANLASTYLSALEGGKGFGGAAKETGAGIKKDVTGAFGKERVVRTMVGGDDILSAYIRGKLGAKKKPEKETAPSKIGGAEGEGGFSSEGATFLKIIAKNSMSLPGMARDMNVLRQNVVKLVKLKGGEARGAADAYFLKQNERERALEAQQAKQGKVTPAAATKKEDEGGLLAKLIEGFFIFLFAKKLIGVLKEIFSPKTLISVFKKVFLPLAIIGTLFSGITDGFKRYKESGSFTEAIVAGLGSMLSFLTFGIFGEDTLTKLFKSISDFFSPITDTISNIFNGIKDFFKGLFGIKTEDKGPKDLAKVNPEMPDPSKFASGAAKASGASDEKAADIGGLFGAVGKGDVQGLFGKAQEFAAKYPEPAATPTSPTPMSSEGVPLDQAQRNYELNKRLTGEVSKALGIPLEAPTSPLEASPTPQSPVATAPTPTPEMSDGDKIKQLEGYIEGNKTRFAKREANAAKHIASFKKRYANDPDRVKQLEEDYASTLAVEKKEMEQANAGFQSQIDTLKKSSKGAVAAASGSSPSVESGGSGGGAAPASGISGGEGGSGAGGAMAEASGGSAPSGNEMSEASSQIAEGQRMESAADQGSVVNAPTTNNQMGGGGGSKPQVADVYNSDLVNMLMRT